jgi:hypothetical protein
MSERYFVRRENRFSPRRQVSAIRGEYFEEVCNIGQSKIPVSPYNMPSATVLRQTWRSVFPTCLIDAIRGLIMLASERKKILERAFELADEYVLEKRTAQGWKTFPTVGVMFGPNRSRRTQVLSKCASHMDIGSSYMMGSHTTLILPKKGLTRSSELLRYGSRGLLSTSVPTFILCQGPHLSPVYSARPKQHGLIVFSKGTVRSNSSRSATHCNPTRGNLGRRCYAIAQWGYIRGMNCRMRSLDRIRAPTTGRESQSTDY